MAVYGKVVGRFFTHQRIGDPVPLGGVISFTPSSFAKSGDTLYGAVARRGYVVEGVLCADPDGKDPGVDLLVPGEGVEPSSWTYEVAGRLSDDAGRTTLLQPFSVEVTAAGVDLVEATPVPSATGEWVTAGRGIASMDAVGGSLVVTYTDGTTQTIPFPASPPAVTVTSGGDGTQTLTGDSITSNGDGTATIGV